MRNHRVQDRAVDGRWRPDWPKPEAELEAARATLRAADADIVALQELGSAAELAEWRATLDFAGLAYPHAVFAPGADGRGVAVLSRATPLASRVRDDLRALLPNGPEPLRRTVLEVDFPSSDGRWTLVVIHLKSRLTEDPDDPEGNRRRLAEARAVRRLIDARRRGEPAARIVVAGDWNDLPGSPALQAILGAGPRPGLVRLDARDSRGHAWTWRSTRRGQYAAYDHVALSATWPRVETSRAIILDEPPDSGSDHRLVLARLPRP